MHVRTWIEHTPAAASSIPRSSASSSGGGVGTTAAMLSSDGGASRVRAAAEFKPVLVVCERGARRRRVSVQVEQVASRVHLPGSPVRSSQAIILYSQRNCMALRPSLRSLSAGCSQKAVPVYHTRAVDGLVLACGCPSPSLALFLFPSRLSRSRFVSLSFSRASPVPTFSSRRPSGRRSSRPGSGEHAIVSVFTSCCARGHSSCFGRLRQYRLVSSHQPTGPRG
jgi:hypothetical protein